MRAWDTNRPWDAADSMFGRWLVRPEVRGVRPASDDPDELAEAVRQHTSNVDVAAAIVSQDLRACSSACRRPVTRTSCAAPPSTMSIGADRDDAFAVNFDATTGPDSR